MKFGTISVPHSVVFNSSSMKFGRSWLMMKRVVSERSGLISVTETERASNGFVRGKDLFVKWFDLKIEYMLITSSTRGAVFTQFDNENIQGVCNVTPRTLYTTVVINLLLLGTVRRCPYRRKSVRD